MSVTIWHNPRCSKSRQTLALIDEKGLSVTIKPYTKEAPSTDEIEHILTLLNMPAIALVRTNERVFKELGLSEDDSDTKLIQAMAAHPILIERPVVIANGQARIGRPPENVLDII